MNFLLTSRVLTATIVAAPIITQAREVALFAIESSHQAIPRNPMLSAASSRRRPFDPASHLADRMFQTKNRPNTMQTYPRSFFEFIIPTLVGAPVHRSNDRPYCGKYLMNRIDGGISR